MSSRKKQLVVRKARPAGPKKGIPAKYSLQQDVFDIGEFLTVPTVPPRPSHDIVSEPYLNTILNDSVEVVVARYNEDIEWLSHISQAKIYNKGLRINHWAIVEELPNIGREGHTFAHYIVVRYDSLPNYTVFLQGYPFDHCPDILEKIALFTSTTVPPSFSFLSSHIGTLTLNGCKFHKGLPLRDVYIRLFGSDDLLTRQFRCGFGAQCIVSRDRIHRHPKEFYEKIRDMLAYSSNPIEGYVIERLWGLIFARETVLLP